jgi:hypothetical protein
LVVGIGNDEGSPRPSFSATTFLGGATIAVGILILKIHISFKKIDFFCYADGKILDIEF